MGRGGVHRIKLFFITLLDIFVIFWRGVIIAKGLIFFIYVSLDLSCIYGYLYQNITPLLVKSKVSRHYSKKENRIILTETHPLSLSLLLFGLAKGRL